MSMQNFKDVMAKKLFGMTIGEAHFKGICIDCKEKMVDKEPLMDIDIREWKISGLCPKCFNKSAGGPE